MRSDGSVQKKIERLSQQGSGVRIGGSRVGWSGLIFLQHVPFAGREKEVLLDAVLLSVELVVSATEFKQRLMRSALDNTATLDHQDLIGAADGRQPVGDYERGASLHQVGESLLNQCLGFGIETGSRLVEN